MFGVQGRVIAAITLRATMGRKRALLFAIPPLVLILVTVALKLAHPERHGRPAASRQPNPLFPPAAARGPFRFKSIASVGPPMSRVASAPIPEVRTRLRAL